MHARLLWDAIEVGPVPQLETGREFVVGESVGWDFALALGLDHLEQSLPARTLLRPLLGERLAA